MPHDPDVLRDNLRKDTCRLLQYDIDHLTAAQEVRLARATMLRLELDDCETKKLNNQPFDVKAYVIASEALERLVGGDPQRPSGHDFAGAREELARFLDQRAEALDRRAKRDEAAAAMPVMPPVAAQPPVISAAVPGPPPPANFDRDVVHIIDGTCEEVPPPEHLLRRSSMNNPASVPLPRKPTEVSGTYKAFADYSVRRAGSFRRFDVPDGW